LFIKKFTFNWTNEGTKSFSCIFV